MFARIVGFDEMVFRSEPNALLDLLHGLYTALDELIESFPHVEKIEAAGDTYICAAGAPETDPQHAVHLAQYALAITKLSATDARLALPTGTRAAFKIGLHCGPAVGGVVGSVTVMYKLFGDTVNTASRMCSYSEQQCVHMSDHFAAALRGRDEFTVVRIPPRVIKGKGMMACAWVYDDETLRLALQAGGTPAATARRALLQREASFSVASSASGLSNSKADRDNGTAAYARSTLQEDEGAVGAGSGSESSEASSDPQRTFGERSGRGADVGRRFHSVDIDAAEASVASQGACVRWSPALSLSVITCLSVAAAAEVGTAAEFDTEARDKGKQKRVSSSEGEPLYSQAVQVELDPDTLAFCDQDDEADFVRLCVAASRALHVSVDAQSPTGRRASPAACPSVCCCCRRR